MKSNNDYITMKGPFYTHEGVKWDVIVNDVSARSMTSDEILSMLRERAKLEVADRDKEAYDSILTFDGELKLESTPHDKPNPIKDIHDQALHYHEQMAGLLQVFQEATLRLGDITSGGYTWVDALADAISDYGWTIISEDREDELSSAYSDMEELKKILAKKEKKGIELPSELSKVYQEKRKRQQEVDYDHE